mgnify:CR=1 FL=1
MNAMETLGQISDSNTSTYDVNSLQEKLLLNKPIEERIKDFKTNFNSLIDEYQAVIYPNLEADDVMGILATKPSKGERKIICSIDKDLRQIPGHLYNGESLTKNSKKHAKDYKFCKIKNLQNKIML